MLNIAIFASGSGTNAENIARIFNPGSRLRVSLVLCNRKNAGVYARMEALGVPVVYVPNQIWNEDPQRIVKILTENQIDLVVLAGFMHYVSPVIVRAFERRILNIHPSLLPRHGGPGMYGHRVHEAVVASGDTHSGVTVHYVTDEMDKGEIVMQEGFDLAEGETPESLEAKIHPLEYLLYPKAILKAASELDRRPAPAARDEEAQTPPPVSASPTPPPTPEQEWAEVLKVKPRQVPPPAPVTPRPVVTPSPWPPQNFSSTAHPPVAETPVDFTRRRSEPMEEMPPTYLFWSIVLCIFCCVPTGIVAIVYSCKTSSRFFEGDYEGARRASGAAQGWIIATVVLGIVANSLILPLMLL